MGRPRKINTWTGRVGFVLGFALVATAIFSWRMLPVDSLGAEVTMIANPSGALGIDPTGTILRGVGIRPGEKITEGTVGVTNQTPRALRVKLRAQPSTDQLDRALRVEVKAGGDPLFSGRLGELRGWTKATTLSVGEERQFKLRIWLPRKARRGWEGTVAHFPIEFSETPVGPALQ